MYSAGEQHNSQTSFSESSLWCGKKTGAARKINPCQVESHRDSARLQNRSAGLDNQIEIAVKINVAQDLAWSPWQEPLKQIMVHLVKYIKNQFDGLLWIKQKNCFCFSASCGRSGSLVGDSMLAMSNFILQHFNKSHICTLWTRKNFPLEFDLRTSHEQASNSEHYWSGKLPFAVEIFNTSVGFSHFACDVETSIINNITCLFLSFLCLT